MVRQHGSLEKDEETNQAAWEAARGALIGGTKVCCMCPFGVYMFMTGFNSRREKEE